MNSPYVAQAPSVSVIMLKVLLALLPAIAAYVWFFGPAILVSLTLASITALVSEAIMLKLRKVPVKPFLLDGSAVVTAWLIALSIPPLAPWWLIVIGTAFAIVVAKQLYGGLGNNLFNPAMVGYAVLIISFPVQMTQWPTPAALATAHLDFNQMLQYMFGGILPDGMKLDALTMATPLDTLKTQLKLQHSVSEITQMPIFGLIGGSGGEIVALCYLIGGLYLWQQRIIGWHVPVAFLGSLFLVAGAFHLANGAHYPAPWFHLTSGGAMLCAFFIATDPVTGPTTPKGKLYFGAGIGLLTYLIRTFGGYPDGVAFGVLIMNICVPLIDVYTQPPVFGKKGKTGSTQGESK
jgi:electron transport complex protein RnfD